MSIQIAKTQAGQFIKTMKEYNGNANPKLLKENLTPLGSIALVRTDNIAMILRYNRYCGELSPFVTSNVINLKSVNTLYEALRFHNENN